MQNIRGLETLYRLVQGELRSKSDCVVAAMHCLMIHEGMLCGEVNPSEMLPAGWNANQGVYTLHYVGRDRPERVLVQAVRAGRRILHVNLLVDDEEAMSLSLDVDRFVGHDFAESFETAYTDPAALRDAFEEGLLQRMRRILEPPQNHPSPDGRSLMVEGRRKKSRAKNRPGRPPRIGGRDLDPFGRGQGGMLYDPTRSEEPPDFYESPFGGIGGLPSGSVPPGAHFDPFGPPFKGPGRSKPDPDEFPPPDSD